MLCLASDWFECSREGRFGVQSELLAESGSHGVMVGHRVLHMLSLIHISEPTRPY